MEYKCKRRPEGQLTCHEMTPLGDCRATTLQLYNQLGCWLAVSDCGIKRKGCASTLEQYGLLILSLEEIATHLSLAKTQALQSQGQPAFKSQMSIPKSVGVRLVTAQLNPLSLHASSVSRLNFGSPVAFQCCTLAVSPGASKTAKTRMVVSAEPHWPTGYTA